MPMSARFMTAILFSAVLVAGCKTNQRVTISNTSQFADRSEKIPMTVSLYVSPEARQYVVKHRISSPFGGKSDVYKELVIGEALPPHGLASLSRIFNRVVLDDTVPSSQAYYIELAVDPKTTMDVGKFTFSEKMVDLHLHCWVKTKAGQTLWHRLFISRTIRENPEGLIKTAVWRPAGTESANKKLEGAAGESLRICLESLNDELTKNRNRIFK